MASCALQNSVRRHFGQGFRLKVRVRLHGLSDRKKQPLLSAYGVCGGHRGRSGWRAFDQEGTNMAIDQHRSACFWSVPHLPVIIEHIAEAIIYLHFDGASRGNPGPSGAGVHVQAEIRGRLSEVYTAWHTQVCATSPGSCGPHRLAKSVISF